VGQLAVAAVPLAPLGVQREDRLALPGQQPVHRVPARRQVVEAILDAPLGPAGRPHLIESDRVAGGPH
jgi:hypothetical protein